MIKLGNEVRCRVTGFTGIATAEVKYLSGCVQFHVRPKVTEEKPATFPEGIYLDVGMLEFVGVGVAVETEEDPGGPKDNTPPGNYQN